MGNGGDTGQPTPLRDRVGNIERAAACVDPGVANAFRSEAKPVEVGDLGSGPQRLTILVPSETTVMNLGQTVTPNVTAPLDTGLTGTTDHHIDFQAKAEGAKTTITLGEAMSAAASVEKDDVPMDIEGYGLATEALAYHAADRRQLLTTNDDLIIHAQSSQSAVLNAETGAAEVNAGSDIFVTAKCGVLVGSGTGAPERAVRDGRWKKSALTDVAAAATAIGGVVTAGIASVGAVLEGFNQTVVHGQGMAPGKTDKSLGYKIAAGAAAFGGLAALLGTAGGVVNMHGMTDAAAYAGRNASMWGTVGASISSALVAGLFGVTADVKGALAGVWGGVDAALAALGHAEVNSAWGEVIASSAGDTEVTSRLAVALDAKVDAQMNAEKAALYGNDSAKVLGAKWGLQADKEGVGVGPISSAFKLKDAKLESAPAVLVLPETVKACGKGDAAAFIELGNGAAKIGDKKGAYLEIKGGTLTAEKFENLVG